MWLVILPVHIFFQPSSRITVGLLLYDIESTNFFFYDLAIFESVCYRTRAKQLIKESNTTGELRKIWTGGRIREILTSFTQLMVCHKSISFSLPVCCVSV